MFRASFTTYIDNLGTGKCSPVSVYSGNINRDGNTYLSRKIGTYGVQPAFSWLSNFLAHAWCSHGAVSGNLTNREQYIRQWFGKVALTPLAPFCLSNESGKRQASPRSRQTTQYRRSQESQHIRSRIGNSTLNRTVTVGFVKNARLTCDIFNQEPTGICLGREALENILLNAN